jgi:predicted DsbA family dithiol-disulfide isomerase
LDFGVEIEIYSDVVCPWCYVGKARLDAALATYQADVTLRWRAFQLDPTLPSDGRPLLDWLALRFGSVDRVRQAMAHVTAMAEGEGLRLDFGRALIANSFDAHRLLWFADQPEAVAFGAGPETQPELVDALHRAHFTDGRDIGATAVLVDVAEEVGLEPGRVHRLLESTEGTADVRGQTSRAYDLGITSVPTFLFAGGYLVTGAQPTPVLQEVLDEVARREGLTPSLRSAIPDQRPNPIRRSHAPWSPDAPASPPIMN